VHQSDRVYRASSAIATVAQPICDFPCRKTCVLRHPNHSRFPISEWRSRETAIGNRFWESEKPLVAFRPIGEFAFPLHVRLRECV